MKHTIDSVLFMQVLGFFIFSFGMPLKVLYNLRTRTSEPDKLKAGVNNYKIFVAPRSPNEMYDIVFGKNATVSDIFLPTKIRS